MRSYAAIGDKSTFCDDGVERLLLNLCMKDVSNFMEIITQIDTSDFLVEFHSSVFSVLDKLYEEGVKVFDLNTIIARLVSLGHMEASDTPYLKTIYDMSVSFSNLQVYINDLVERSYKYKLHKELGEFSLEIKRNSNTNKFCDLAAEAEQKVVSLTAGATKLENADVLSDNLESMLETFKERKDAVYGLPSNIPLLDYYVHGFEKGRLYIVAARPKEGKSCMLMNWALLHALDMKLPILYFDTEMKLHEVQTRALACRSGVREDDIKSGKYAQVDEFLERVEKTADEFREMQYFHKWTPRFDINAVRRLAKKYKLKYGIGALYFDYIKMQEAKENMNETQYLGNLATTLKDLAGELEIPVITAAQLSRVADRAKFVTSTMVGESDRILRFCDVLLALNRKAEMVEPISETGTHKLQILENRSGATFYKGVDIYIDRFRSRIEQAKYQSEDTVDEQREIEVGF